MRDCIFGLAALMAGFSFAPAWAQSAPPPQPVDRRQELRDSWSAASKVAIVGPQSTSLKDQGAFAIPAGAAFIPLPEASRLMRAMGNGVGKTFIGLAAGTGENDNWIATISFKDDGYIKDDDAKDWNADELLTNLKDGTEENNKDRLSRGFPAIEVTGWIEKPTYVPESHNLIWSVGLRDKGSDKTSGSIVNYNTYVLGREGFFSLDFITSEQSIEAQKPIAKALLAGITFSEGKRYEDYNPGTDKLAAYGLAALVGGAMLKKLGLFALIIAFVAKFAKAGLLLAVGAFYGFMRLFRRNPRNSA